MERRKELKEQYKQMKPDMGVFGIRCGSGACYIEASKDLKSMMNRTKFQLSFGSHPCKELQASWKVSGEAGNPFQVLEKLEYDKDESKTDYSEELALLLVIWEEKLTEQGIKALKKQ